MPHSMQQQQHGYEITSLQQIQNFYYNLTCNGIEHIIFCAILYMHVYLFCLLILAHTITYLISIIINERHD